ncbi:MAG: methyltransferase domain-containing protein [Saprospiraceae bacterium]|nr:methyltransferase domain-containing protein [Saprospiraceae bacterium]
MKSGRTFKEEASIPFERYLNQGYFERKQFDTMISQILAVVKLNPTTVLEIGPGNGFVTDFLRKAGINVVTFDINENLKPDVLGNLIEIDTYFENDQFDLILCAEVLEHLPFDYFDGIIEKFSKLASKNVVITLPRQHRILLDLSLKFKLPFINYKHLDVFWRIPSKNKWEEHHWEIDYRNEYSLKTIKSALSKHMQLFSCYVDERNRSHQFFILNSK